ncbi:Nramp family divalent metal transporter [Niabella sp. W65]|nr:Nramp family divalent metal transporter [Niabella sp. W65]MCH7364915.1 Nramp family divalent metal transporter [Niabella sp. W65]ULT40748.1 Nramp family divalent metal transporter [Niabella sp. I65]
METYTRFFGPAYLVSVGYMDPGNWATDLAGGSQFGYSLLWVLVMSNLMALLLQSLSARLGIVRNRDLAQANRETYLKRSILLYIYWRK